ncbi:MAG: sulfoxide reductase heme-binding subunit YedZ [Caldilineae bacterium]|nr:MAG: sulfoxide reductase heme-binding subunit YedZ [Caldilineae bacterium]
MFASLTRRFLQFQTLVHLGALAPFLALLLDIARDNLSVNPIQDITFRTGKAALVLLVLTLAATPLNTVFGFRAAIRARRALGLYAFGYALLHFLIFSMVDYGLDLPLIWVETLEKPYIYVGFSAFLILLPLALTSTRGWQRRLGRTWKRLHRLVYMAGILVIIHYVWVVKADIRQPLAWGVVVLILLAARLSPLRRYLTRLRSRLRSRLQRRRRPTARAVASSGAANRTTL